MAKTHWAVPPQTTRPTLHRQPGCAPSLSVPHICNVQLRPTQPFMFAVHLISGDKSLGLFDETETLFWAAAPADTTELKTPEVCGSTGLRLDSVNAPPSKRRFSGAIQKPTQMHTDYIIYFQNSADEVAFPPSLPCDSSGLLVSAGAKNDQLT
jgi:hypothetical protein